MKKSILILSSLVALTACRESNTSVKSAPTAQGGPVIAKTLCFDTTFVQPTQQVRSYTYNTEVVVGTTKTLAVPLRIDWTTIAENNCPQVASMRVYQVGKIVPGTEVRVRARRDMSCKLGMMPNSPERSLTKYVYISLSCEAKSVHSYSSFRFVLNGLGYHDTLDQDLTTATTVATTKR